MPPKKNVKISTPVKIVPAVKLSGKSRKRTKPLEVPNITITCTNKINSLDVPDTEKRVNLSTKIALADEVAKAQLLKAPIEARLPPKKKGRQKKPVVSEFFSTSATDVTLDVTMDKPIEEIKEEPPVIKKTKKVLAKKPLVLKQPPAKKIPPMVKIPAEVKKASVPKKTTGTKKRPVKTDSPIENSQSVLKETAPTRKRAADSTEKKPRNKRKKVVNEAKEPCLVIKTEVEMPNENAALNPNVVSTPATQQLGRGKRKYVRRGAKTPVATDACIQSPRTLNSCIDSPNVEADMKSSKSVGIKTSKPKAVTAKSSKIEASTIRDNADASETPCINSTNLTDSSKAKSIPVDSRKTSISSVSNLSWTRDISSSSVTTSVTVLSKDFVRFNNKMPVIKLTNIDSEVNKYKANESDKDSSDDSSSDSNTSEQTGQLSDAGVSSFIYNSPVKVNSLNLSLSSPYSTRTANQINKKNYGKAAQNLVQALKKIDLEFVSWIQEAEYATSDLNKIKDKLFDILSSEFCAISHCRNLQRITDPDFNLDTNDRVEQTEKDKASNLEGDNDNQRVSCNQVENIAIKCSLNIPKNNVTINNKESGKDQQNNRVSNVIETNTAESKRADRYRLRSTRVQSPIKMVEIDAFKSNKIDSEPKSSLSKSSIVQNKHTLNKLIRNTTVNTANRVETRLNVSNHIEQTSVKDSTIESAPLKHAIEIETKIKNTNKVAIVGIPKKTDIIEDNNDPTITNLVKTSISSNTVKSKQRKFESKVGSYRFDKNLSERNPENNRLENNSVKENMDNEPDEYYPISNRTVQSYPVVNKRLENVPSKANLESNPYKSNQDDTDFLKPSTSGIIARKFDVSYKSSQQHHSSSDSEDFAEDVPIDSFSQSNHDDDDALSLYAESITGIESSRMNTSIISAPIAKQTEEYIPEPVKKSHSISPKNYTYYPSKISEQIKNGVVKPVCEKQNADSTSIYKDSNNIPLVYKESNSTGDRTENPFQELNEKFAINIEPEVFKPELNQQPRLMAYLHPIRPREVNIIFKGYCYYFLVNKCLKTVYNNPCRFVHNIPSEIEIRSKLARFSEEVFIKEYLLVRRNDLFFRKYGLCFVRECMDRKLTRILVEMAYDFLKKDIHSEALKVGVVELTLLHLNNFDLVVCDDLLKMEVTKNMLLCEMFMEIMTCTQNFSQFKPVFLSLTYFMVNNDRTFKLEVAEQILERVSILPYDEPVVRAFIQIMRLTGPEIFLNSMVVHFEKQIKSKAEIWGVYESMKSEINFAELAKQAVVNRSVTNRTPLLQSVLHQTDQLLSRSESKNDQHHLRPEFLNNGVPLPPSPDTTNLDNLNKTAEDTMVPRITRTIWSATSTPGDYPTAASPNSPESDKILNYSSWRHKSILHKMNGASFSSPRGMPGRLMRGMRPHRSMRSRPFNRRLVTFGNSPVGYPPPGPDY